jgi:hypothetical protein
MLITGKWQYLSQACFVQLGIEQCSWLAEFTTVLEVGWEKPLTASLVSILMLFKLPFQGKLSLPSSDGK